MSLSTMANNILRFCPGLNADLVKSLIQDSYRQLCSLDWQRLRLTKRIITAAPYSTGTISVAANGTVTGVGTSFTSSMIGRFMRVYYSDPFFEILTVPGPTSLTLGDWTGEVVAAGTTYTIFKTIFELNSLFGIIYELEYQAQLSKKSQSYFNQIDPSRLTTSSSPSFWAFAGVTSAGVIKVELYPVPSQVVSVGVYGKVRSSTLGNSDSPLLPEDLIEARSLLECYRLKDIMTPKQGWDAKLAQMNSPDIPFSFPSLLALYQEEDYQLEEHRERVKDVMGEPVTGRDDNFALSHDVE